MSGEENVKFNLSAEDKEAQEHKELLKGLLKHPGWLILLERIRENVERRKAEILYEPIGASLSLEAHEFTKGEISGLEMFTIYPQKFIDAVDELEELYEAAKGNADDDE